MRGKVFRASSQLVLDPGSLNGVLLTNADADFLFPLFAISFPFFSKCNSNKTAMMATERNLPDERALVTWQSLMDNGRIAIGRRALEISLHHFTSALHMCETYPHLQDRKYMVLGDLGWISRLSGKYAESVETLEEALALADAIPGPPTKQRISIAGELGTLYRLMDRYDDAKRMFAEQYKVAKGMGPKLSGATCRAIGNLGMANYQRALELWNKEKNNTNVNPEVAQKVRDMVKLAIEQQHERIKRALKIQDAEDKCQNHGETQRYKKAIGWEAIGHSRLSLCYTLLASVDPKQRHEMLEQAESHALSGMKGGGDDSNITFARFFYGRVLLLQGEKELANTFFNPHLNPGFNWTPAEGTPAIAFSQEHSLEHRVYLREIVESGADLEPVDDEGYDALQYTIFNGDKESEKIILDGFRKKGASNVELNERRETAHLRKGYREIFQEKLRPLLYQGKTDTIKEIRRVYAQTIEADPQKSSVFDHLKYIRYTDFKTFGRLPRSSDGLVKSFKLGPDGEDDNYLDFLIFFSYRWINTDRSLNTPDDADHTQYRRMLDAIEQFLEANTDVDMEMLCIWMVSLLVGVFNSMF